VNESIETLIVRVLTFSDLPIVSVRNIGCRYWPRSDQHLLFVPLEVAGTVLLISSGDADQLLVRHSCKSGNPCASTSGM